MDRQVDGWMNGWVDEWMIDRWRFRLVKNQLVVPWVSEVSGEQCRAYPPVRPGRSPMPRSSTAGRHSWRASLIRSTSGESMWGAHMSKSSSRSSMPPEMLRQEIQLMFPVEDKEWGMPLLTAGSFWGYKNGHPFSLGFLNSGVLALRLMVSVVGTELWLIEHDLASTPDAANTSEMFPGFAKCLLEEECPLKITGMSVGGEISGWNRYADNHPSTHPSTRPSFHPSVHPSIHPSVYPPVHSFFYSSTHSCTHLPTNQLIHPSIH